MGNSQVIKKLKAKRIIIRKKPTRIRSVACSQNQFPSLLVFEVRHKLGYEAAKEV